MANILKVVLWGVAGSLLLISGVVLAVRAGAFVTGSMVAAIGLWVLLSIKIVGPAEMAVFVLLGDPIGFRDSGVRFVPFLFAHLVRYPKKMYNFNYRAREVVTKAAVYEGVSYGAQVLKVDAVVYLNFPKEFRTEEGGEPVTDQTHPLIEILRAGVPIPDKELEAWTEEAVVGALRVAFGRMTWRQAVEDIEAITREAEDVFRAPDGALIRAGFPKKGIRLVVAEIHLPPELQNALPHVDRQRLEAEAAPFEARQRAEETAGAVIEAFHSITGMERTAIETALREDPEGFISRHRESWNSAWDAIHRRMAIDGRSFLDIRVQGAEGLERGLLNLIIGAISAWQRMPPGSQPSGEARTAPEKGSWPALEQEEEED